MQIYRRTYGFWSSRCFDTMNVANTVGDLYNCVVVTWCATLSADESDENLDRRLFLMHYVLAH